MSASFPRPIPILSAAIVAGGVLLHCNAEEMRSARIEIAAKVEEVIGKKPALEVKHDDQIQHIKNSPKASKRHPRQSASILEPPLPALEVLKPQEAFVGDAWCSDHPDTCHLITEDAKRYSPVRFLRQGTRRVIKSVRDIFNKEKKQLANRAARQKNVAPGALDEFLVRRTSEMISQVLDGETPLTQANAHTLLWMLQKTRYDEQFAYAVLASLHMECGQVDTALEVLANDYDDSTRAWKDALIDLGFDKNDYGAWQPLDNPFRSRCKVNLARP